MESSEDVVPQRNDREVEPFTLMALEDVQAALMAGQVYPNRTMTYLAHFVLHWIVNAENEPQMVEPCTRQNRRHLMNLLWKELGTHE